MSILTLKRDRKITFGKSREKKAQAEREKLISRALKYYKNEAVKRGFSNATLSEAAQIGILENYIVRLEEITADFLEAWGNDADTQKAAGWFRTERVSALTELARLQIMGAKNDNTPKKPR